MSLEFLQFRMPCADCVIQAICKDKHYKSCDLYQFGHCMCLALPAWDPSQKMYVKGLTECWVNLGYELLKALRTAKLENRRIERGLLQKDKCFSVPNQYVDFLIDLINTMQWMINSTSWREGELHNFDSYEIKRSMKNITNWLRDGK